MEIVRHTGLAKSIVHQHMVLLRSAESGPMDIGKNGGYALRREVPDRLHGLFSMVSEEGGTSKFHKLTSFDNFDFI